MSVSYESRRPELNPREFLKDAKKSTLLYDLHEGYINSGGPEEDLEYESKQREVWSRLCTQFVGGEV